MYFFTLRFIRINPTEYNMTQISGYYYKHCLTVNYYYYSRNISLVRLISHAAYK